MLLRDRDRETLLRIFASVPHPIEVWAYGSRVNGDAHEGSDLDLVVRTHDLQRLPLDVFLDLKDLIEDSTIPILVDLFDWARLPESFQENILRSHEVLFSSL